ncbi:MAG: flagellar hook-basal body protein [Oligoflexales bacterium]|nr:flagellar hook-basal body protein [Oligoflexales bacterium]
MLKSIYTPLSGAVASERVLEIIANNLANVSTTGFKGEKVSFKLLEPEPYKSYRDPLPPANYKVPIEELMPFRGNEVAYVGVSGVSRDLTQGSPIATKNPFDVMIEGDGFFSVHTKEGIMYTRNGAFSLSEDGALVDKNGFPVLGEKGNIFLHGHNVNINHLGEVYQDGELVDTLLIKDFKNPANLEKVGMNHFFYDGLEEEVLNVDYPNVKQGFLESSNVNAIKNLTDMILAHRSFEAYQQAIKNYDSMMEKSHNTFGEVQG